MFKTVFRWELRALRLDLAFWAVLTFGIVALGFALVNGERWRSHLDGVRAAAAQQDISARATARATAQRINSGQQPSSFFDPRNSLVYANYLMSHSAVLPATPIAALAVGQSDLLPSALPLAPGRLPSVADGSEPENPHRLLIGRFDPAFAVIFLFPLLIIGMSYALLAGERERGTLALLLAQPLTMQALFVGKIVPRDPANRWIAAGFRRDFSSYRACMGLVASCDLVCRRYHLCRFLVRLDRGSRDPPRPYGHARSDVGGCVADPDALVTHGRQSHRQDHGAGALSGRIDSCFACRDRSSNC
ncbi:ABC transporter permease subunit [Bradyrhizobium sp. RDT10]